MPIFNPPSNITGNATPADVARDVTLASAGYPGGATGTSTKNATFLIGSPFKPMQANADALLQWISYSTGSSLKIGQMNNVGLEDFAKNDGTTLTVSNIGGGSNAETLLPLILAPSQDADFSNNPMSSNAVGVVLQVANSQSFNGILDLTGDDMSVPPPAQVGTTPEWSLEIKDFYPLSFDLSGGYGSISMEIVIGVSTGTVLLDSFNDTGTPPINYLTIGVQDQPTLDQIAQKIADLLAVTPNSIIGTITATGTSLHYISAGAFQQNLVSLPVGCVFTNISGPGGSTYLDSDCGTNTTPNADIANVNANGGTVKYMRFVNGLSGAKEIVIAAP